MCSTLGVTNHRTDRNNVKNVPQGIDQETITRQITYENTADEEVEEVGQEEEQKQEQEQEEEREGKRGKVKEIGYVSKEEEESIEKDCTNALCNKENALNSTTESELTPTVSKRGSLRLSFEAAMSLRRRNMSLKEQNLTVC